MNHLEAHELIVWLESRGLGPALANAKVALETTGNKETALDALLISLDPSKKDSALKRILGRKSRAHTSIKKNTKARLKQASSPDTHTQVEIELLQEAPPLPKKNTRADTSPGFVDTLARAEDTLSDAGPHRSLFRRIVFEGLGSCIIFFTVFALFKSMTHGNTQLSLLVGIGITTICWAAVLKE